MQTWRIIGCNRLFTYYTMLFDCVQSILTHNGVQHQLPLCIGPRSKAEWFSSKSKSRLLPECRHQDYQGFSVLPSGDASSKHMFLFL